MKRFLHKLRYFCADAWDEWRHSPAVNVTALGTLTAALFVAGLVMLVLSNLDRRVQGLREELDVHVYLTDGHTADERAQLVGELEALPRVARVEFVDKAEALRRYRSWAAELAALSEELAENPLPASLEVFLSPGAGAAEAAAEIAARLGGRPGVEDVRFDQDWLRRLAGLVDLARVGGTALAVLVFLAVIFVMASVLRLAVYARRDEIEVMQLVGASPGFIRGPFLVAGAVQGLLAAVLAIAVVEGARRALISAPSAASGVLVELLAARPLPWTLGGLLLLVGLVVSLAGSFFAVRQPA